MAENTKLMYPAGQAHITIKNKMVTRRIEQQVQESYTTKLIKEDMCNRLDWSSNGLSFNPCPNKACPCCKTEQETVHHFMHCTHNKEGWKKVIPHLTTIYNKQSVNHTMYPH
eukprot:7381755-Ditylum_brightwellii.AAC.1